VDVREFILARVAEDEERARAAVWTVGADDTPAWDAFVDLWLDLEDKPQAAHMAAFSPARVLAQCAALRAVVEDHEILTRGAPGVYLDWSWTRTPDPQAVCQTCGIDDGRAMTDGPCWTLLSLARIWSAHPDYDAAWARP
jgi:hypothetical protein